MAKPEDPFAGVKLSEEVGLDQRLFETQPEPKDRPTQQPVERPVDRKVARPVSRPKLRPADRTTGAKTGPPKVRHILAPTEPERVVEHRAYDFFQDQVRWLNRRKVEFEETYGKQIAATRMVQLAVDLLIADYEANGEDSQLVRVLIAGEEPAVRPAGGPVEAPAAQEEEGPDG